MVTLFEILHEDADLLVLRKPAGLVCHPTKGDEYSSLVSRVRIHLGFEPHMIHRLDRETGGVMVFTKTDEAGAELFRELETRDGTPLCDLATPCWSSQRGMHYLFRLADPIPDRGWVKRSGLEFRFGGKPAQSVLPPSVHPTGRPYSWLVSPSDCEPAAICLADLGVLG